MTWRGRSCHECRADGRPWILPPGSATVSCVVAFAGLTGAPAERALLVHAVTVPPFAAAAVRTVVEGNVGLGAAPLPGRASGLSSAPLPGTGARVTAVFDGRLDGRGELVHDLRPHLTVDPASASDADLITGRLPGVGPRRTGAPARRLRVVPLGRPRAPARVCARSLRRPPALLRAHLPLAGRVECDHQPAADTGRFRPAPRPRGG